MLSQTHTAKGETDLRHTKPWSERDEVSLKLFLVEIEKALTFALPMKFVGAAKRVAESSLKDWEAIAHNLVRGNGK